MHVLACAATRRHSPLLIPFILKRRTEIITLLDHVEESSYAVREKSFTELIRVQSLHSEFVRFPAGNLAIGSYL